MSQVFLSADMGEALAGLNVVIALFALVMAAVCDRRSLWILPAGLVAGLVVGRMWGWDELFFMGLLASEYVVVLCVAFVVYRRLRVTRQFPHASTFVLIVLAPVLLGVLDRAGGRITYERGPWAVLFYVAGAAAFLLVWALSRVVPPVCIWASQLAADVPATPVETGRPAAAGPEHAQVMALLNEGKLTPGEAAELLEALEPPPPPPADRLPLGRGEFAAIIGGLLVTVGFVLPWAFVKIPLPLFGGTVRGYQAGYHLGVLGWLVLALGVLPAVLCCIPALDSGLRQGLLRLVIAAVGGTLTAVLCLTHPANLGIWTCLAGFTIQLLTALGQSGLVGRGADSRMASS